MIMMILFMTMIIARMILMVIVIVCKYSHNHDNEVFKVMMEKGD